MKLAYICMAFLIGISSTAAAADPIKGNGKVVTKKVDVADYNEIHINGTMEFRYEQTANPSALELTLDENLHDHLLVEVKNRVLTISFKGVKVEQVTQFVVQTGSKWLKEARVEGNANLVVNSRLTGDELAIKSSANSLVQLKEPITTGSLTLKITGSGNIVADHIEVQQLNCDLDGTGSITIKKGKAPAGKYSITGNSDLHAYGMEIADLICKMTGGGLAEVYATNNLSAAVTWKGDIRYKGNAKVEQKIIGKGKIENAK